MLGTLASLIPTPLHPAVVHLPMALAVTFPFNIAVGIPLYFHLLTR